MMTALPLPSIASPTRSTIVLAMPAGGAWLTNVSRPEAFGFASASQVSTVMPASLARRSAGAINSGSFGATAIMS